MRQEVAICVASIVIFMGCSDDSEKAVAKLQHELDSTMVAHNKEVDLLEKRIRNFESVVQNKDTIAEMVTDTPGTREIADRKKSPTIRRIEEIINSRSSNDGGNWEVGMPFESK